jgi:hypothetical protein
MEPPLRRPRVAGLAQYPVSCAINAQETGDAVKRFFSLKNFIEL